MTGQPQIASMIENCQTPALVFTLSWCSYCHAVKQLLSQLAIDFTEVELDTGIYAEPELNRQLRGELRQMTGSNTLPQVFIHGQGIGGFTETRAAAISGKLQALLADHQPDHEGA